MTEQATDAQVIAALLTEEEILGYRIKPWTLKQLIQVMPILDHLAGELRAQNISLEGLERLLEQRGIMVLLTLLQAALPQLPDFLAISLRAERAEMEELDLGQAMQIAAKILALNVAHLKNAFDLVLGQAGIRQMGTR